MFLREDLLQKQLNVISLFVIIIIIIVCTQFEVTINLGY